MYIMEYIYIYIWLDAFSLWTPVDRWHFFSGSVLGSVLEAFGIIRLNRQEDVLRMYFTMILEDSCYLLQISNKWTTLEDPRPIHNIWKRYSIFPINERRWRTPDPSIYYVLCRQQNRRIFTNISICLQTCRQQFITISQEFAKVWPTCHQTSPALHDKIVSFRRSSPKVHQKFTNVC